MGYLSEAFNKYYSSTSDKQKNNIKRGFKEIIWSSLPYTKLNRSFKYNFSYNSLDENVVKVFEKYKNMDYKLLKSRYNINELQKEDLVKARINSNYGKYFDNEVYYKKEYYRHLAQYKNIYFNYLEGKVDDLQKEINKNNKLVEYWKEESLKSKCEMDWEYYKAFINMCFDKIFDNYIPLDEKIKECNFTPNHILDWDEDNYILGYVNKSLNGYLKNYIKEINGKRKEKRYKQCENCGKLIEAKSNKTKYCDECAKEIEKINVKKRVQKHRKKKCNEIEKAETH